jgi:hypothetical protein
LAGILLNPSLVKRGKGRFCGDRLIQKIPLYPPFPKGEYTKKDSGQTGMTYWKPFNNV